MGLLKKISEIILTLIGPVGTLIALLIIILVWIWFFFVDKPPLNFKQTVGLVVFSFVLVGLGNLIVKIFTKKKREDSRIAKKN